MLPMLANAQYIKQANSVFNGLTVFPNLTVQNILVNLNGATSLLPNPDTIRANSMQVGSRYEAELLCQATVPTVSIPTLTVRIMIGGNTMVLTNGVSLLGTANPVPFRLKCVVWITASNTAVVNAWFDQSNGTVINLPITSMTPLSTFTVALNQDMMFNITAQYGGISLGTTSLKAIIYHREIYQ